MLLSLMLVGSVKILLTQIKTEKGIKVVTGGLCNDGCVLAGDDEGASVAKEIGQIHS